MAERGSGLLPVVEAGSAQSIRFVIVRLNAPKLKASTGFIGFLEANVLWRSSIIEDGSGVMSRMFEIDVKLLP